MSNRNRKKKGDKNLALQTIVLITAILQLIETLMEIIKKLIE